jgi:hypothetical protein
MTKKGGPGFLNLRPEDVHQPATRVIESDCQRGLAHERVKRSLAGPDLRGRVYIVASFRKKFSCLMSSARARFTQKRIG